MNKMNHLHVAVCTAATGLLCGILVAGCSQTRLSVDSRLPDQPRMVGGGIMIEWKAPEPGTAFLIEKRTGKIVETRSLEAGGIYSFSATSIVQADEFEQMLGIPFSKAQFLLYFEPRGEEDTAIAVTSRPTHTGRRS